jgi:hypothetical protein
MGRLDESKTEVYVMVDIESSGAVPGETDYSMLTLGAVVIGQHRPPFNKAFYVEMQPLPLAKVDPRAMEVNKLDIERLKREGKQPNLAMLDFRNWVVQVANPVIVRPVMVSMGTFDAMFVPWYFDHFGVRSPFSVNSIDMKSCYFAREKCRWGQSTSYAMASKHPEWDAGFKHTHNALDDAIEQAERFERVMGWK